MIERRKWTAIPGLMALAVGAIALSAYSGASSPQGNGPQQPIAFPHPVHVKTVGMSCVYCHSSVYKSPDPGMPAVSTCMGCHTVVGPQRPAIPGVRDSAATSAELTKLWEYAGLSGGKQARPIPWVRIHKVPEYVHFPHMRHVNAGVTCQTCHGQVQEMARVSQAASLNMGWCVNCHVNGYDPQKGLEAAGYAPPAGSTPPAPPQDSTHAGTSYLAGGVVRDGKRLARYDCASCHF